MGQNGTVFRWKDRSTFTALFLRNANGRNWGADEGLSDAEVLEFAKQTADSAEHLLSPGVGFRITYWRNSPQPGKFTVHIEGLRRDSRGFESQPSFFEISSFVVHPAGKKDLE